MATTASRTTAIGTAQRRNGTGPPTDAGTKSRNAAAPIAEDDRPDDALGDPQADRAPGHLPGRVADGGGDGGHRPILAVTGRNSARATMEGVMPQQVPTVPATEVPEDAVVLDVREDDEWVHGHIDGATHIPMGDVPSRLDDLPEGDPLYVTCRGGGRSARVAAWLNQNGFDAVNVGGGMGQWEAAGRPMVSETGQPPFVR